MGLLRLIASKRFKRLTGISMIARGGRQLLKGDRRTAALLVGAGALAFRSTWAGILAELGIQIYRRRQKQKAGTDAGNGASHTSRLSRRVRRQSG